MRADRRGEVLDATYECLTRYGVRRTTMEDIASVAGMSRAAVYQYVRNKDDAFRGLAEATLSDYLVRTERLSENPDIELLEPYRDIRETGATHD